FQDGHFRIESGPPRPVAAAMNLFERNDDETPAIDFTMTGAAACSALGFSNASHSLQIEGPNVEVDGERTFAAGIITTAKGRKYGVIRIPLFQQREYATACESAWDAFRSANGAACDEGCQDRFSIVAKRAVAQALADDARELQKRAPDGIVIDLTGNGGGTEWAEFAAAALTPRTLKPPAVAMIRGPHWQKTLRDDIALFDRDLAKARVDAERTLLTSARTRALAMLDSTKVNCDLHSIWTDRNAQPACWNITGVQNYMDSVDLTLTRGLESSPVLLPASAIQQVDRPYDGPIFIMTDANTASASEQFAGVLVDNGVAKTIGSKTMGVGCGYTNGGNPIKLEHDGLTIWMPDCARLRPDGSNEFEGIKPNYPADWGNDAKSRAQALSAALDKIR
ncbi:MAG TPA: S41 family peptidase, partial [Longimicrobiales bacterium]